MKKQIEIQVTILVETSESFADEILSSTGRLTGYVMGGNFRNNPRAIKSLVAADVTPMTPEQRRQDLMQFIGKLRAHDWRYARADSSDSYRAGAESLIDIKLDMINDTAKIELFEQARMSVFFAQGSGIPEPRDVDRIVNEEYPEEKSV